MQVHAVGLGTRLVFHEVGAVLCGAQAGLDRAAIYRDVVDALYGAQCIVALHICHVRTFGNTNKDSGRAVLKHTDENS